jgi:hypothetical protein
MSENREKAMTKSIAQVGYSKDLRRVELVVPHGTKTAELSAIMSTVFKEDIVGRLGRGCQTCVSGDHLFVREQLEQLIEVDLERR